MTHRLQPLTVVTLLVITIGAAAGGAYVRPLAPPPPALGMLMLITPFMAQVAYLVWASTVLGPKRANRRIAAAWVLLLIVSLALAQLNWRVEGSAAPWALRLHASLPSAVYSALVLIMVHFALAVRQQRAMKAAAPHGGTHLSRPRAQD